MCWIGLKIASSLYTVSQKRCHQTHSGNFIKSQLIFKIPSPLEREGKFTIKSIIIIISHRTLSMLPHYLWEFKKFKFVVKLQNIKNHTIFVKKTKVSFIWLNGYCYYQKSCSKCPTLTPTHARRRRHHSSVVLSMMLWSTAAAKHAVNAAITFYDF